MISAGNQLLAHVEHIEMLEEQRRNAAADITTAKLEAKAAGFDLKAIAQMIRERRMGAFERAEWQSLCDVYRAALGMLDGTPLGDAARRRLAGEPPVPPPASPSAGSGAKPAPKGKGRGKGQADAPAETPPEPPPVVDLDAARAAGAAAAAAGQRVTDNPHAFNDPQRAAWDEGWCSSSGSDGMDIPEAFRRRSTKKVDPPAAEPERAAQPTKRRRGARK